MLVKPKTFMNLSGNSVYKVRSYFKLTDEPLVIAHDELSFRPGQIRFKLGGGAGGHNGLKDIISHIGSDFYRIRIGIGSPVHNSLTSQYVLGVPPVSECN